MGELLRQTTSICPECMKNIPATIEVEGSMVVMKKKCDKHGDFKDKLSSDVDLYKYQNSYSEGLNSLIETTQPTNLKLGEVKTGCPYDCGMCKNHKSAANLMIIDITNRCNLNCPICFANSNRVGRIVEYSYDEVHRIMKHFVDQRPNFAAIAQFSGGEPTLHPRIIDILKDAKDIGFPHRMLNTNGIRIAKDLDFTRKIKEVDCGATYLSFDGIQPETYKKIRGLDISKTKLKALENMRIAKLDGVMLVQTICKGINDHEVENVLKFAHDNNDIIAGVIYQPVSLCGRVAIEDLMKMRYTNSDLLAEVERATGGQIKKTDFYPLGFSNKLTELLCWFSNSPAWSITAHDDCGFATLAQIQPGYKWKTVREYADVEGFIKWTNQTYDMIQKREVPKPSKLIKSIKEPLEKIGLSGDMFDAIGEFSDKMSDIAYRDSMKAYYAAGALKYFKNLDIKAITQDKFYTNVAKLVANPVLKNSKGMLLNGTMMLGSMHFQDAYNMDTARVEKCVVHYGVLDPKNEQHVLEIPFCTFNTIHREGIEKEWAVNHSKALDITAEQHAKEVADFEAKVVLQPKAK